MTEPALFYTGLVAELYAPLRQSITGPEPYARFIGIAGQPALELGCGHGEPLIDLRRRGLDVEGLDSSPDMLALARTAATEAGVDVVLHLATMESMDLDRRYRSIFLAGPTFNLLPDDDTARRALARIAAHLDLGGSALIPLFVPQPTPTEDLGVFHEAIDGGGEPIRFSVEAVQYDTSARVLRSLLRYERNDVVVERTWTIHWFQQDMFRAMAEEAGLTVTAVRDAKGDAAMPDATAFVFWLTR